MMGWLKIAAATVVWLLLFPFLVVGLIKYANWALEVIGVLQ
jgi:hypothetical protein